MSNETVAPAAPKPTSKPSYAKRKEKIPFYTTPKLVDYYNQQIDKKFQRRGEDIETHDGHEIFYKPAHILPEFPPVGNHVETLTEVQDGINPDGSPRMVPDVYAFRVKYRIDRGYTQAGASGGAPVFVYHGVSIDVPGPKATEIKLAALFLEDFEEYGE